MTIKEIQQEIIDEFAFLEDWMEKYEHRSHLANRFL